MKIAGINREACTLCGACAQECCADLFRMKTEPGGKKAWMVREDPHGWCTGCGHCLAVCPQDAIQWEDAESTLEPAGIEHPENFCSYEALLPFLQSKRSVRRYRAQEPGREQITAVLEAMRWAPTGHNLQANRYLAITDRRVLQSITDHTIEGFRKFRTVIRLRKLLKPFLPRNLYKVLDSPGLLEGVDAMIYQREQGKDPILFDAPAVIVVYYPEMGALSLLDPTIAFTYGMLAAHALGLGSCWIGFAIQSLYKNKTMHNLLGVPSNMIIAGVMTLGYPLPVYHRIPPRNPLQVRWLDEGNDGSGPKGQTGLVELAGTSVGSRDGAGLQAPARALRIRRQRLQRRR
jgi:nitroreductase/NAD-dependent dihydropyrimidine dehydrogenase PreA subunit